MNTCIHVRSFICEMSSHSLQFVIIDYLLNKLSNASATSAVDLVSVFSATFSVVVVVEVPLLVGVVVSSSADGFKKF